jgi:glucokinase
MPRKKSLSRPSESYPCSASRGSPLSLRCLIDRVALLSSREIQAKNPSGVKSKSEEKTVQVVAGVDLGGTAINYTLVNREEQFLIEALCEHPALSRQGPEVCLRQIADGLKIATDLASVALGDVVAIGLDTPGPASAAGQLSARGSTNFVHPNWAGFDIRAGLAQKVGLPVSYLNDANAAALWGHYSIFGANSRETSVSDVVGTGNGGGIILDGNVV